MSRFISPLTWPGGKAKQWKLIKNYLPKETKKMKYIEPFFGGGSVGLNALKEELFNTYTFNDLDNELMLMWIWFTTKTDYSKINEHMFYPSINLKDSINFYESNNYYGDPLTYIMRNNLTFNGNRKGTFTQQRLEQNWNTNKFHRIIECAKLLFKNKDKITFENKDYQNLINLNTKKDTFYFLDPPYFNIKGLYTHEKIEWTIFSHSLNFINAKGSKFLLTINDCKEARKVFKDWNIYSEEWKYTSSNTKKSNVKTGKELIITNYKNE